MNCIIIHGSPSKDRRKEKDYIPGNKKHWIPWVKNKLSKEGISTLVPLMPTPWRPIYEEWKEEFEKLPVNENTILIGHSAGASFLVRWLGETNEKVKKLILIAPSKICSPDKKRLRELYNFEINKNLSDSVNEIIIFVSNDREDIKKSAKIYHEKLGGKLIELKNKGHYTLRHMGTEEFPELLKEVLE